MINRIKIEKVLFFAVVNVDDYALVWSIQMLWTCTFCNGKSQHETTVTANIDIEIVDLQLRNQNTYLQLHYHDFSSPLLVWQCQSSSVVRKSSTQVQNI